MLCKFKSQFRMYYNKNHEFIKVKPHIFLDLKKIWFKVRIYSIDTCVGRYRVPCKQRRILQTGNMREVGWMEVANCLLTDSLVGDGHLLPVWRISTHLPTTAETGSCFPLPSYVHLILHPYNFASGLKVKWQPLCVKRIQRWTKCGKSPFGVEMCNQFACLHFLANVHRKLLIFAKGQK